MNELKIRRLSEQELIEKLNEFNERLDSFVGKKAIEKMLYGVGFYGHLYEDKTYPGTNTVKPTGLNCLAIIAHNNPDRIIEFIKKNEFEQFLRLIGQVAMCLEVLCEKFPDNTFTKKEKTKIRELGSSKSEEKAAPGMYRACVMIDSCIYHIGEDTPDREDAFHLCSEYIGMDAPVQIFDEHGNNHIIDGRLKDI